MPPEPTRVVLSVVAVLGGSGGLDHSHRPRFHFYQHNPFGDTWGHMSWGHAVRTDLVRWRLTR